MQLQRVDKTIKRQVKEMCKKNYSFFARKNSEKYTKFWAIKYAQGIKSFI